MEKDIFSGPDVQGFRKLFGVIGPATNTIVQPDFDDLRVPGVTNHYSRIPNANADAISNETFDAGVAEIGELTEVAARGVLACEPDYLVMGMSAVTFYGGKAGGENFKAELKNISGLDASIGSESLVSALNAYGGIKKIAFVSPYYPTANTQVRGYVEDFGYEVLRDVPLRCPTWTAIARVQEQTLREVLLELDGDDVDAICQVGTNLSMIRLAAEMEVKLQKPVIAINTATYWHALRNNGIDDQLSGFGRLMSDF